ncbi:MAG: DUF5665 domain-containing protein [Christensenellales bacterium]
MGIKLIRARRKKKGRLKRSAAQLAYALEKLKLADYIEYLRHPGRLLWRNFLSGIARGFGMAVGFTLLGAMALYILQKAAILNLPVIGDFIADIVRIVDSSLNSK